MSDFEPLQRPARLSFDHQRTYPTVDGVPRLQVDFRSFDPSAGKMLRGQASVVVIVDSGAAVTMLPWRFAAQLRIPLDDLPKTTIRGAGGAEVPCYGKVQLEAQLCGQWVELPVRFFAGDERKHALLGRAGAFEALHLAFIHGRRLMYAATAGPIT